MVEISGFGIFPTWALGVLLACFRVLVIIPANEFSSGNPYLPINRENYLSFGTASQSASRPSELLYLEVSDSSDSLVVGRKDPIVPRLTLSLGVDARLRC